MRKIATLSCPVNGVRRVMLYEADGGTYLFLYTAADDDGPCEFDHWYASPTDAEDAAATSFGVRSEDWTAIPDPPPGARHDWIRPTRTKRDPTGNELPGQFEPIPPAG